MQRRGSTLLELLVVLALLGMLISLTVPRLTGSLDGIHAGQAARRIALAHARARAIALTEQRIARVVLTADSVLVLVGDTLRWQAPGPSMDQAMLSGDGEETRYAPNGMAMGAANARHLLTRGAAQAQVLVSRLGRVRIVRGEE